MIKLIVSDFDGTLADSKKIIYPIFKRILNKYGYDISDKKIEKHLGLLPLGATLETFGVKNSEIKKICDEINEEVFKSAGKIKSNGNLSPLGGLEQRKIILSNTITSHIKKVIGFWKINYFDEVYGADKFSGKKDMFEKLLRKYKLKPQDVVYIGDRTNDVQLAQAVGCISVAMASKAAWSKLEEINETEPDFIIKDWRELPRVIEELDS